jgi:16S rRNA (adenine1518-N6/adenine1519-N6)-dimethyltransferase
MKAPYVPRRAKKRLGQHFLHDPLVLQRIADAARLRLGDAVLEIGAGTGNLTVHLSDRVGPEGTVLALELDADLLPALAALARERANIRPVRGDFLEVELRQLLKQEGMSAPVSVAGNIPYAITTPILERLIEARSLWRDATLLVQDEVARRMTTPPGQRGCGSISVLVHYWCAVEYCFRVGEGAFSPPPRVKSAAIRLSPRPSPPVRVSDEGWFFEVVRAAFGQRRKTLRNALSALCRSPAATAAAVVAAGIDPRRRGETLSMTEFAALAEALWRVHTPAEGPKSET